MSDKNQMNAAEVSTAQVQEEVITGGAIGRLRPNWRLCLWWVALGTASSFIGAAAVMARFLLNDAVSIDVKLFSVMPFLANMGIIAVVALLQAQLLKGYGVKVAHWLIVTIVGEMASAALLMPLLDSLYRALGVYEASYELSSKQEWLRIIAPDGPVLWALPGIFLLSTLQGLLLALGGPKSRLGWWVLASLLGHVLGSLISTFAGMFVGVALYNSVPALPLTATTAAWLLSSALLGGAIFSTAQGVTLALFFKERELVPHRTIPSLQLPPAYKDARIVGEDPAYIENGRTSTKGNL